MMGKEHPLNALDPNISEVIQNASIPKINKECCIVIADNVNVASIRPDKQIGVAPGVRLGESGSEDLGKQRKE
jgi:hypothetical protein